MEIFRKGLDPPLIFGSYGTREEQFNFGHKNGKKTKASKNTQNGYI